MRHSFALHLVAIDPSGRKLALCYNKLACQELSEIIMFWLPQKSYWLGDSQKDSGQTDTLMGAAVNPGPHADFFESLPEDQVVGIRIRNLKKVAHLSTDKRPNIL